jgi:hypothetical protein
MSINSHLSTCVGTQSPKYLEMTQGHISLSVTSSCYCLCKQQNYSIIAHTICSLVPSTMDIKAKATESSS